MEYQSRFIRTLHDQGLTIIESMKAVMTEFGVGLGEAKILVTSHEAWAGVVAEHGPLHEEAIALLDSD